MYKSPKIFGLHLREYGNYIRDVDSIATAMGKESRKLIARSRSIIKPSSGGECDSVQAFLHKYPFVGSLVKRPGVIPHHLVDLLICGRRQPINTHNRSSSLLFGENVYILKLVLLCSGAQKACRMTACQDKTMNCLTNAVVSLYLSQKFHDALEWQPDAAVMSASSLPNNATAHSTGPNLNFSQQKLEGKHDKVVVLIGDLFITEIYSWLVKMPSKNNIVHIISENLASFSQNIFMNSQNPECDVIGNKKQILPEKAIRSLFASAFLSAGILAQTESQVGDRLENLGNEIGGLYYEYLSTLYFLKSKHMNPWSERNVNFREQWKARVAALDKRRRNVVLMESGDQHLTSFYEDLMNFLTYRWASDIL